MHCPKHGDVSIFCRYCDNEIIALHDFRQEVCKRVLKFYEGTNSFHGFDMPLIDSYYPNIEKAVEAATDDTCILPYRSKQA